MIQLVILVCALSLSHRDCTPSTALDVLHGPDASNILVCMAQGQQYLASSAIKVEPGSYVKVECRRSGIGKANVG